MRNGLISNLSFHGIGRPPRPLEPGEEPHWVGVEQFEEILDVVIRYPSVRITFDDGNASDIAVALPALERRGLTATFFVLAGRLGKPGSLTTADVRTLVRARMTVGSHGMWHRSWRSVTDQELREELTDATADIAYAAGGPVREAACPFGAYDRRVLSALRRHGFTRVYTADEAPAASRAWLQPRYTVHGYDTPADIERLARFPLAAPLGIAVAASKSVVKRWR